MRSLKDSLKYSITSLLIIILVSLSGYHFITTNDDEIQYSEEIKNWQLTLNMEFADSALSPLTIKDRAVFNGLYYYPANIKYRVKARFEKATQEKQFGMKTTTERRPIYIKYGVASFKLNGKDHKINIYQNIKLSKTDKYKNHLFMLFTDLSSGKESYAGGRYIDLQKPSSSIIEIDFNKSYNPYCSYNHKYSCPIPPKDDHFDIEILAGCKKGFY